MPDTTYQQSLTASTQTQPSASTSTTASTPSSPFSFNLATVDSKQSALLQILDQRSKWKSVLSSQSAPSTSSNGGNMITGSNNTLRGVNNQM